MTPGEGAVPAPPTSQSQPPQPQTYVRDWYFHCNHHVSPCGARGQTARDSYGRDYVDANGNSVRMVQVVADPVGASEPSKPGKDLVHFYWKDEELGSPPKPELFLTPPGAAQKSVPPSGGEAGYTDYPFEVPYTGGQDAILFFLPSFWREFNHIDHYRLSRGPQPLVVQVHHPRKYKFELSMPPLRGYKRGVVLGGENTPIRQLAEPQNLKRELTETYSGWGPSTLNVPRMGAMPKSGDRTADAGLLDSTSGPLGNAAETTSRAEYGETGHAIKGAAEKLPIKFYRDDTALDPAGLLTTIAAILRLYRLIYGIIDTIKDYAPQAGFYIDFDLQLLTGGLAVEWQWKEFDDHRVYGAVDVNAKVTLISAYESDSSD